MSKIVFFSIPAYGHTNPTIEVINELTKEDIKLNTILLIFLKKKSKMQVLNI